jgi:hypothetical protein|tara:strand:- start:1543 stop:2379 length:837 start_codon:yes stop_codon:yes gene_type:complete
MKHNKKRNVGIIYELLLKHISTKLLEGNKKDAKIATRLIEKHFKKGTELYKEFRLFNALAKSNITHTHTVASILNEAKIASRKLNKATLEKEKSLLLKDINYKIADKDFYYRSIADYRDLGVVQLSLNEWRKKDRDIKKLVDLEVRLGELMLRDKNKVNEHKYDASHSDRLVLKIMTEKFNRRYGEELTTDQKKIIEGYVFLSDKNPSQLQEFFKVKKQEALVNLENFEDTSSNKYLLSKLDEVREKIASLPVKNIDDQNVVKFLTLTKMISEIKKEL